MATYWFSALGLTVVAMLVTLNAQLSTCFAQGTAFTYQGKLNDGANPATGVYDLRFTIYDSTNSPGNVVAGPLTNAATGVSNGLFSVTLDFGAGVFTGPGCWLQLDVRTNGGGGAFAALSPRQPILPVPYTVMANSASNLLGTLPAAQLSGTLPASVLAGYSGTVTLTNGGNSFSGTFSGSFTGSGAGLTSVPGSVVWQNVTSTSQQAQPNTGYLANNAAQVTITLPTAPNLGDIVRVSGVGVGGWQIAQNAGQAIQAGQFGGSYTNWSDLTNWIPTSAPTQPWVSIASSADGTRLAAAGGGPYGSGGIYTSTNSGVTWTQTSALSGYPYSWDSIASSADGTKLAAFVWGVSGGGGVYTSTNSGVTWTQTYAYPGLYFYQIASSADGTKLAAGAYSAIYTSTNSGVTWTQAAALHGDMVGIASSVDGTKLATVTDGGIYTSTNSGVTWNLTGAPSDNWLSIASSADGTKLAAAAYSAIYTSTDGGTTWTQTSAPTNKNWSAIASSADGTKLAATTLPTVIFTNGTPIIFIPQGIYISANSGGTWTQTSAPGESWGAIASSSDGSKLAAVVVNGGIWTAQATIQATTTRGSAGYLTGGQNSAIELQYIGDGVWLPLSHEGTISAY